MLEPSLSPSKDGRPKTSDSDNSRGVPHRINLQKLAQWADDASRQEITEQLLHQAVEIQRLDDIAAMLTV